MRTPRTKDGHGEKFEPSREYSLKSQGHEKPIDPRNAWVYETYRNMVYHIVRTSDEAVNISQMTQRLCEIRRDWREFAPPPPKNVEWRLPKGTPTRKTVSKHLKEMQDRGWVVSVGGLYVSTRGYIEKYAGDFNQSVRQLISNQEPEKWNFLHAGPVAGCYVFSDPPGSHRRIQDLLHWQQNKFRDGLFWLNDILRYAISVGELSTDVFSKHELDGQLLKKGWEGCFADTKLVILAFAFSPPKFLEFLNTYPGKALAKTHLEQSWDAIKSEGRRAQALYRNWKSVYSEERKS